MQPAALAWYLSITWRRLVVTLVLDLTITSKMLVTELTFEIMSDLTDNYHI